jgi:hypothetical protein
MKSLWHKNYNIVTLNLYNGGQFLVQVRMLLRPVRSAYKHLRSEGISSIGAHGVCCIGQNT